MGSNGKLVSAQLKSFLICNSNGLQWALMVSILWISLAMHIFIISNSNGLKWATMVSRSQLDSSWSTSAILMDSNWLVWTPMGSHFKHRLNQLNHAYIHNLHLQWALKVSWTWLNSSCFRQLQWTPMGSNSKHRLNQLNHVCIHNLKLQ